MNAFQTAKAALSALALATSLALPAHAALVAGPANLSINDVSLAEGNVGTTSVFVRFSLDLVLSGALDIQFGVGPQTASFGTDYTTPYAVLGSTTIAAGATFVDMQVADILGDLLVESDETFTVSIASFTATGGDGVAISDGQGLVTILNDDQAAANAVPEPGSAALVGLALAGVLAARRRRS